MSTTRCLALLSPNVAHAIKKLIETKSALMRAVGITTIDPWGRPTALHRRHGLFSYVIDLNVEACEALTISAREEELTREFGLNDAEAIGLKLSALIGTERSWQCQLQMLVYKAERARRSGNKANEARLCAEIKRLKVLHAGHYELQRRDGLQLTIH